MLKQLSINTSESENHRDLTEGAVTFFEMHWDIDGAGLRFTRVINH